MMSGNDDGFDPHWTDEKNWLVDVVRVPKEDDPGLAGESLDYIGRLFAFAFATDTRMLALVGDPETPAYELWFSFKNDDDKQTFLQLVRDDGYANPDEECCFDPPESPGDLAELRPISLVFPEDHFNHIAAVSLATLQSMGVNPNNTN